MYELLIVDDEKYVLDSLASTYPWEELQIGPVHTASSANEALKLCEVHNIHIVITDIRMPGLNGLELIDKILLISPKTKCILLSGYSEFEYAQRAISSRVAAYLLKPVKEEELMKTVRSVVRQIRSEWEEIVSRQRLLYTFNEHLPILRSSLLNDLIQSKNIPPQTLAKKLETLNLKIRLNQPFALMFVRLEQGFSDYDEYDRSLLEFGVCNICEEIFSPQFNLWQCKDVYDNLIFVISHNDAAAIPSPDDNQTKKVLEKCSLQLQDNVSRYLRGSISVLISDWGVFPRDLYEFYQKSISIIRSHPNNVNGFFISMIQTGEPEEFQPLRSTQEPPTLLHLLEAARWEEAEQKFERIIQELRTRTTHVPEYLHEVALLVSFSIIQVIHKHNRSMEDSADIRLLNDKDHEAMKSIDHLHRWGKQLIRTIKDNTLQKAEGSQRSIIQKINEFVQTHLDGDISLQTIADHVYLHPAYVSKIYKLETGEGISDYIYRLRMEKAAHLLRQTNEKIHDIAKKTGYQNPSHFSRVFKKYFHLTPDEFREKDGAVSHPHNRHAEMPKNEKSARGG